MLDSLIAIAEDLDPSQLALLTEMAATVKLSGEASAVIQRQRKEMVEFRGVVDDLETQLPIWYHTAYRDGWAHLYNTSIKFKGTESGGCFEDLHKAILTAAVPSGVIGSRKSQHEDHDNFIEIDGKVVVSNECKLQSDATSLRKALGSYIKNVKISLNVVISFATNNVFTSRNGEVAVQELINAGISHEAATNVVSRITLHKTGWFRVTDQLYISILGTNTPEYKANGKYLSNHSGSKGWTLDQTCIRNIVEGLAGLV